ncbi:MAG: tungstate ABC transporter ATP-binding protein WtpC [Chloroflexota bacterium]|nr:tungstate ABC transporter ATP-binding protein WtpC [Chloroflexota bacterium]
MIVIKNLKVNLGEFLLQDINLEINSGEYFIILGPTGAGKTVLLEAIAGLYSILEGRVWINGREITSLNPEKREIGIVYQDQALFPHLSVEQNIAFGLRVRKCSGDEIKAKINDMAELLRISHLLGRSPVTLSGGEKQKVALARALVIEPKVLLLDEPLSALDPETKEKMQGELRELHRRLKTTIVHVTHDFEEAVALGHRVAVLNEGCIAQVGTTEEFLRQPSSEFVARFALSRNIFSGRAEDGRNGNALVDIGGVQLRVVTESRGEVHLSLRPEDILISEEMLQSTARNCFHGVVSDITDKGSVVYITVSLPPDFICLITRQAFDEFKLRKGMKVWITFKASAVHVF